MFEYCVTRCAKNGHFKFMGLTEAIKNVVLCKYALAPNTPAATACLSLFVDCAMERALL